MCWQFEVLTATIEIYDLRWYFCTRTMTYLLPTASPILDRIVGFQLDLPSQDIRSRIIAAEVITFQVRQDRSDSVTNGSVALAESAALRLVAFEIDVVAIVYYTRAIVLLFVHGFWAGVLL